MSGMPDKLDEIIQEVAIRHGYVISPDDPVLMTYTINQKVIEAGARIQQAVLEKHRHEMDEIASGLEVRVAGQLDRVLREATESSRLALRQEAEKLFSQQRMEIEAVSQSMMENCLQWRRFTVFAMAAAIMTLVAAVMVLSGAG